jgi:hypothetical protein
MFPIDSFAFSSHGNVLTWETAGDDINQARISSGEPFTVECSDIAENWGFWENSIFDSLCDNSLTIVVDFNVSNWFMSENKVGEESASSSGE